MSERTYDQLFVGAKPCPFCAGTTIKLYEHNYPGMFIAVCEDCGAIPGGIGWRYGLEEAKANWQKRKWTP